VVVRAVNVDGTVGEGDVMVPELLVAGIIITTSQPLVLENYLSLDEAWICTHLVEHLQSSETVRQLPPDVQQPL
jgi:hypothetical protein